MQRRPLLVFVAVLVLTACARTEPDAPPRGLDGGVRGTVTYGPMCPVVQAGSPCPDRPWQGTVRVTTPAGALVTEITTDRTGAFSIPLGSGTYVLAPVGLDGPSTAKDRRVQVTDGAWVTVALQVDSGIR